ncbi:MAG: hypothetical protein JO180_01845 [Gemmatirosa sp.]|nr:hypothetical protein [Gemmatirosa sp.]
MRRSLLIAIVSSAAPCLVAAQPQAPTGLMVELLAHPERTAIETARPSLGWIVEDPAPNAVQRAYQVRVASSPAALVGERADVWDSGRVPSAASVAVRYGGAPLHPGTTYWWTVRTWDAAGRPGPYADPQTFRTGALSAGHVTERYPLVQEAVAPRRMTALGSDGYFVDFGRAAFGTLQVTLNSTTPGDSLVVHLGEKLAAPDRIDRAPGGTIRYRRIVLPLLPGLRTYRVQIPPDQRNTGPQAIKMPASIGEVMPFRYAELEHAPPSLGADAVRQLRVTYPFDESASWFASSDTVLDAVWALSKYSIEATTFAGIYVDGDRERIPYEADAYIDQLGHYSVDREYALARASHEYLVTHPTWPTEWILHSVLMAWADYEFTGDTASLARYYDDLKAKTLASLAREDGLVSTQTGRVTPDVLRSIHFAGDLRDIVDWPQSERDGYDLRPVNTVVNAFHYAALDRMADIAAALGHAADARDFRGRAERVKGAVNARLLDPARGVYVDGEGSSHSAIHANLFPLAFGLVPAPDRDRVVGLIESRGMAVSVYAAQYLLEALYRAGDADHALRLLTATGNRGWAHMAYDVGSTVTLEAWDIAFKPNLDWNHAWGAAPANVIPRWLVGVRPLAPGFARILVQPQPGALAYAEAKVPTIRGPVYTRFDNAPTVFRLEVRLPANTTARVALPLGARHGTVTMDGRRVTARVEAGFAIVDPVGAGRHVFELR